MNSPLRQQSITWLVCRRLMRQFFNWLKTVGRSWARLLGPIMTCLHPARASPLHKSLWTRYYYLWTHYLRASGVLQQLCWMLAHLSKMLRRLILLGQPKTYLLPWRIPKGRTIPNPQAWRIPNLRTILHPQARRISNLRTILHPQAQQITNLGLFCAWGIFTSRMILTLQRISHARTILPVWRISHARTILPVWRISQVRRILSARGISQVRTIL